MIGTVSGSRAAREFWHRLALDPEFFTALTVAAIEDAEQRAEAWERATEESTEVDVLGRRFPDIIRRLRRAITLWKSARGESSKWWRWISATSIGVTLGNARRLMSSTWR